MLRKRSRVSFTRSARQRSPTWR